jgi:epoxyqueuosine reductase
LFGEGRICDRVIPIRDCQLRIESGTHEITQSRNSRSISRSVDRQLTGFMSTPHSRLTADAIKRQARVLGFDVCGVAPAADLPELQALPEWLARGYAGDMIYLHKSAETRSDIRRFLPTARSVIVTGSVYFTPSRSITRSPEATEANRQSVNRAADEPSDRVRVARYARGQDYHHVLADRLNDLVGWMRQHNGDVPFDAAIFVDKHHVQERVYARHAGIGWIGKNTCVINRDLGSWMLLAGVATSLPLEVDPPAFDQCGACTLCLDACPTGALVEPHTLDATRCISYLTIELQTAIPEPQRGAVADHLFGCDICQDVCPWNLAPARSSDPAWQDSGRDGVRASALWQRTDDELHRFVKGSAMTHLSLSGLRRNLALVIGNSRDPSLAAALDRPGRGVANAAHSAHTPMVEDAVAWARQQLDSEGGSRFAVRDSRLAKSLKPQASSSKPQAASCKPKPNSRNS